VLGKDLIDFVVVMSAASVSKNANVELLLGGG